MPVPARLCNFLAAAGHGAKVVIQASSLPIAMYILGQKLGKDMENLGSGTIPGPITITFGRREEKQKPHSSRYLVVKRGSRYDRLDGPAVQEASYDDIEVEKVLSEAEDFTEAQQLAPGKTVALQPNTRSKRVLIKRPA